MPVQTDEPRAATSQDFVLSTLQESVKAVLELNDNPDRSKAFSAALTALVDSFMPDKPAPKPDDDKCKSPDPVTKPLCSALKLAEAKAGSDFGTAQNAAAGNLYTAVNGWNLAVSTYDSALESAQAVLEAAVTTAIDAYNAALKQKPDAPSRALYLWYTLKEAVVTAVQSYESSVASAASALVSEAGTALSGYSGYAAAIGTAEGVRANALAAAHQAFWQAVETGRDT